jgi:hypothetical protein
MNNLDENSLILSELYSNNQEKVYNKLYSLINKTEEKIFKNLINSPNLNIPKIFIYNIKHKPICNLLPDFLLKTSIYLNKNVIKCFNNCGACFLCVCFNIVYYIPSLEGKIYSFLLNYLGDYDGKILEKKSFKECCLRTANLFQDFYNKNNNEKNENKEYCKNMEKNIWSDYIQGMGRLFIDDDLVEKIKEDPEDMNYLIEKFIKDNDVFDYDKAEEFVNNIKSI